MATPEGIFSYEVKPEFDPEAELNKLTDLVKTGHLIVEELNDYSEGELLLLLEACDKEEMQVDREMEVVKTELQSDFDFRLRELLEKEYALWTRLTGFKEKQLAAFADEVIPNSEGKSVIYRKNWVGRNGKTIEVDIIDFVQVFEDGRNYDIVFHPKGKGGERGFSYAESGMCIYFDSTTPGRVSFYPTMKKAAEESAEVLDFETGTPLYSQSEQEEFARLVESKDAFDYEYGGKGTYSPKSHPEVAAALGLDESLSGYEVYMTLLDTLDEVTKEIGRK